MREPFIGADDARDIEAGIAALRRVAAKAADPVTNRTHGRTALTGSVRLHLEFDPNGAVNVDVAAGPDSDGEPIGWAYISGKPGEFATVAAALDDMLGPRGA